MSGTALPADRRVTELVRAALEEDLGDGDRTGSWTIGPEVRGAARVIAKGEGVLAGTVPAELAFRALDPDVQARWIAGDGARLAPGETVLRLRGLLGPLLAAERTALNFLGRLSGIATAASRYVEAVRGTGAVVVDTRKTTPGWRALEKAAVAAGGARNHRMGLYDMVLVKENHARVCGGIRAALDAVTERAAAEGLEVEVEVRDLSELDEALAGAPQRIMLDNMSEEDLREAVRRVRVAPAPRPLLEASGGVTLATVRAVAETGVDLISVGAITHSAPVLDLSLLVEKLDRAGGDRGAEGRSGPDGEAGAEGA